MNENKRLHHAIDFINIHLKEEVYEQEFFDDMTDEELLEFIDFEDVRTDIAIDDYKENYF